MESKFDDTPIGDSPVVDAPSCRLLGPTALIVQGVMGVLVILSLIYKRHRESPKRPWRICLFDVAKQVAGQMFVHAANVGLSDVLQRISNGSACVFYFLNVLVDTTLGVGVIYVTLHTLTNLLTNKLHLSGFTTGQYGDPPSINYWLRQATVYVLSITTMKLLVVALFAAWPGIFQVGQWLLSWTRPGTNFQIVFVMGLFPIAMNILQFWLIDSIVKASSPSGDLSTETPRDSSAQDREPLFRASMEDGDDDDNGATRTHDIENPLARSPSPRPDKSKGDNTAFSDEHKSTGATTPGYSSGAGSSFAMHAYPPQRMGDTQQGLDESTPTSVESRTSRRRSPPPSLPLRSAFNSPATALEHVKFTVAHTKRKGSHAAQNSRDWDLTWNGADDWAERVGEEYCTGRRVEATKGFVDNIWDRPTPVIQVG